MAVVTLALGLGAAAVVAVIAHALLLRPLPFPEPDRLVEVWPQTSLAKEELVFLREHSRAARWGRWRCRGSATAAGAGWVPARRALRLDPVEALRTE